MIFNKCLDETLTENDFDFVQRGQSEKKAKGTVCNKIIAFCLIILITADGRIYYHLAVYISLENK